MRERRREHFTRAIIVGVLAGAMAVAFQWGLYYAEALREYLLACLKPHPHWGWAVLPVVSAAICAATARIMRRAPETSGSGIPHVKAVGLYRRTMEWRRVLPVKFITGVLGIGAAGLSLGREGPTVQMGAAIGQGVARTLRVAERSERHLVTCGAGAGLAAAFNAPLAGFIFVIEELQREMSPITYGTALIAALSADVVARTFTGQLPSFHVHGYPTPPLSALPIVIVLGAICGLLGVAFNRTLLWSMAWFRKQKQLPGWLRMAAVGAVVGLVAWWLPEAVGGGHGTGERILRGEYSAVWFILVLLAAKFILTMLSYGCGASGGLFAPLLVIGALAGSAVGHVAAAWFPGIVPDPAAFAVIGMAALFTAIVRAPLTGIVLITEMTANYEQMLAVAVACLGAYAIAEHLRDAPIYDALLDLDLQRAAGAPTLVVAEPVFIDIAVEADCSLDGRQLHDIELPEGCSLVTVTRFGREMVPRPDMFLLPGDQLIFIVSGDALHIVPALRELATCDL